MDNYSEDYVEEEKKFRITRGMLLLAAIILVIIIIIIIVLVSVFKSREPKYKTEDFKYLETRMKNEAEGYLMQNNKELSEESITIKLEQLLVQGDGNIDPNKVKAAKICEGYVIAYKDDEPHFDPYIKCGKYYTTKGYKEEEKQTTKKTTTKDTEKPVITIIGEKDITIEVGFDYKDEGAKANDNIDGDITSNIKVVNGLDINKVGEYKITYTVSDKAGNISEEVRSIRVIAKPEPTTVVVKTTTKRSYSSGSKKTTARATTKKITTPPTITLRGKTYETVDKGNPYMDPGYVATDAKGADITSRVSVSGSVNTNVAGTYTIKYSVTDSYGNSASKTRTVKVNSTYVALQGLTVTPNNVSLKVGATVKITVNFIPTNASNKNVTWKSSNTKVATVTNGTIKGVSKGSADVIVTGADNKFAKISVVVK